ncbi:glycogen synthase [Pajaroellobacter abortibovis]|uniref:Glycogen synthase n=1 Tax=Pajaroellobacter abortibovis TaxID=1882918 RepID=A0A1L6MX76_9BACT|nr:glycogen/starch synthase [Pajaroellobacter abortibovis]APS00049.1 hypothetical protein BCY86_04660 [Pajaroellobacter abortibovis]
MISSEVRLFAQTGGLGDAVLGLSKALAELGVEVALVTPRYRMTKIPMNGSWWPDPLSLSLYHRSNNQEVGVFEAPFLSSLSKGSLRIYLLDIPHLFDREGIYGDLHGNYEDNDVRFATLSQGALAVGERIWNPSLLKADQPIFIHAHDWHAAPALLYARLDDNHSKWQQTPLCFTIHNLAFQGIFEQHQYQNLNLPMAALKEGTVLYHEKINLMKGAILLANAVTTVSTTYAKEIMHPQQGCGLDPLLCEYRSKITGIVNGIDTASFNPEIDTSLVVPYNSSSASKAKQICKASFYQENSFEGEPEEIPLFVFIARIDWQKGIDLLLSMVPSLLAFPIRLFITGSGDPHLENLVLSRVKEFPGKVVSQIPFNETLARRALSAADFIILPSRYEPCGLTQLYAMRYGAIPLVTPTGGLYDTVDPIDIQREQGTGIIFSNCDTEAIQRGCMQAIDLFHSKKLMGTIRKRIMQRDSSWEKPAREYIALYKSLLKSHA